MAGLPKQTPAGFKAVALVSGLLGVFALAFYVAQGAADRVLLTSSLVFGNSAMSFMRGPLLDTEKLFSRFVVASAAGVAATAAYFLFEIGPSKDWYFYSITAGLAFGLVTQVIGFVRAEMHERSHRPARAE